MNLKRLVISVVLALAAAFPAGAGAAGPSIPPPEHDHYLDAFLPTLSHAIRYNEGRIFSVDTSTYTVQNHIYDPPYTNDGPGEPNICVYPRYRTNYGKTMWFALQSKHWGRLTVRASGSFDEVIGVVPFESPNNMDLRTDSSGNLVDFSCADDKQGLEESLSGIMVPGQWYAFQVGGTQGPVDASFPDGGLVQMSYKLRKPAQVGGRAFLFWNKGGRHITKMYVTGVPRGATLRLRCTKGACKRKKVTVKGKVALGKASVRGARVPPGSSQASFKPIARGAAKRVNLIKAFRKRIKRGAKIELRISSFGHIGRYYRWNVKRREITSAVTRCLDVGKSKPKKKCTG